MSIQQYFGRFHKEIKVETDELREKRDILIDKIRASLKKAGTPLPDLLNQGSYIYGVGVKPEGDVEYDIDVGLDYAWLRPPPAQGCLLLFPKAWIAVITPAKNVCFGIVPNVDRLAEVACPLLEPAAENATTSEDLASFRAMDAWGAHFHALRML